MEQDLVSETDRSAEADGRPGTRGLRALAMELLDFYVVRQRVADHTTFFPARQLALRMGPASQSGEVERLQQETAEGRILLEQAGDVSLHGSTDASGAVTRAALEGILTGVELLMVADALEVHRNARSAILRAGSKVQLLMALADGIPDLDEIHRQIRSRIGLRGDVADDATPALGALRGQVRQAYERVTEALTNIIRSPEGRESLQDHVISIRGDRFVVQVKAEMRHRVPGIVHDASNTGATLFVEPFATVGLCNAWKEQALEEEREVTRVLRNLSALVGAVSDDIHRGNEMAARLDFILARARYSAAIHGVSALSRRGEHQADGAEVADGTPLRLLKARHPLIGKTAVPISVSIGPGWSVLVITGPNTGGKTVAMKTVGLLALMHQSGLQVPADEGSCLPVFSAVYADVGDQQDVEQSVSSFGSHMRNVVDILAEAGPATLVLLDEIGSSTNPEEGSALAKAVLGHLASRGIPTIATTHHRTVAEYAEATPGLTNASVALDPSTLAPTYHLTMGVPGRSYAMAVAARLGLPDEIMEEARTLLEPQHLRFEDWLDELQREREQLQVRLQEAEKAGAKAEALRRGLEVQLEYLVTHREEILDSTRREVLSRYEDVQRMLRRAEGALSWGGAFPDLADARAEVSRVKRELESQKVRAFHVTRRIEQPLTVGQIVHVRGLNMTGKIESLSEQAGEAEVNIGKVRLRVDLSRLSRVEHEPEAEPVPVQVDLVPGPRATELDLRGLRAEDAVMRLESFLDKAIGEGLSTVRIIHGRGTGALRQAVREHLSRHPLARSFAPEPPERGGNGATVVELA